MGGVCGRGGVLMGDGAPTAEPDNMPAGSMTGGALAADDDADEDASPDGRVCSDWTSCIGTPQHQYVALCARHLNVDIRQ